MFLAYEKLGQRIKQLEKFRYSHFREITTFRFWIDEQAEVAAMPPEDAEWGHIAIGDRWEGWDLTAWLKAEVTVPEQWGGRQALGLFDFGKTGDGHNWGFESLLYIDGVPFQGVGGNHQEVFLPEAFAGRRIELLFKVWSGLSGADGTRTIQEHRLRKAGVAFLETDTDDLYYSASAAYQTLDVLEENSWEHQALLKALDRALHLIDWRIPGDEAFYASVSEASLKLKEELAKLPKTNPLTITCIGHTHIDVAWLWRLKHTREKAARSFSTVLRLMEQFPEYVFLQTQPQLYEYIEQDYPELFAKIRERVVEGRWEAAGAMWLESDCNVPSGESLVRQLVYGMRYFEQRLGSVCDYLWLPDVFGYSWALPQILKKSGIKTFMTTKISWNVYNRFPNDTFHWRGIDGTEILTHYITTPEPGARGDKFSKFYTYNGQILPSTVTGIWKNYRDKEINDDELLLSYGYGDGGGGPTRTMLEMRRRLENMPGIPTVVTGRAGDFFDRLEKKVEATDRYVHRWDGELYLELHRGTYTSQAYNKRMNRKMELLLRDAEIVSSLNALRGGFAAYPQQKLYDSWKIVLRNQFHDILPGSSITEVYEDCRIEYAEAEQLALASLNEGLDGLSAGLRTDGRDRWLVFNSLPWKRCETVELAWEERFAGGGWRDAAGKEVAVQKVSDGANGSKLLLKMEDIPSMGYSTFYFEEGTAAANSPAAMKEAIVVNRQGASTPFYTIEWNASGQLTRLYDKRLRREVLAPGETANRFDVHEDKPAYHDNWEIDIFYVEKVRHVTELLSCEVVENNPIRTVIRFAWQYGRTAIKQDMILYPDNPRIDFATWVDWQERETLLKVAFPVLVRSASATYEIQFGSVQRPTHWNTSWDYARFESCAHKWVDLSERGLGVSLLNDCKYGHDIKDHVMRITLIKSSNKPDPDCDRGEHTFTYALLPHEGDWFAAGTVEQAHRLNVPITVAAVSAQPGNSGANEGVLPEALSMLAVSGGHVIIDTVKKAEDSDAWIVRCYEYAGKRGDVSFATHFPVASVDDVNLMEREPVSVPHERNGFDAFFAPFELKTFQIFFVS